MNAQPFPAGGFAGPAHGTDALYEIGGFLRHVQGHPTQLVGGRDRSLVVGVIRLEPRCVIGGAGLVLGMLSVVGVWIVVVLCGFHEILTPFQTPQIGVVLDLLNLDDWF